MGQVIGKISQYVLKYMLKSHSRSTPAQRHLITDLHSSSSLTVEPQNILRSTILEMLSKQSELQHRCQAQANTISAQAAVIADCQRALQDVQTTAAREMDRYTQNFSDVRHDQVALSQELRELLTAQSTKLQHTQAAIGDLQTQVRSAAPKAALAAATTDLRERVSAASHKAEAAQRALDAHIADAERAWQNHDADMTRHSSRLTQLGQQVSALHSELSESNQVAEREFATLRQSTNELLQREVRALRAGLATAEDLAAAVAPLAHADQLAHVASVAVPRAEFEASQYTTEGKADALARRVSELHDQQANVHAQLDELTTQLGQSAAAMNSAVAATREDVHSLSAAVHDGQRAWAKSHDLQALAGTVQRLADSMHVFARNDAITAIKQAFVTQEEFATLQTAQLQHIEEMGQLRSQVAVARAAVERPGEAARAAYEQLEQRVRRVLATVEGSIGQAARSGSPTTDARAQPESSVRMRALAARVAALEDSTDALTAGLAATTSARSAGQEAYATVRKLDDQVSVVHRAYRRLESRMQAVQTALGVSLDQADHAAPLHSRVAALEKAIASSHSATTAPQASRRTQHHRVHVHDTTGSSDVDAGSSSDERAHTAGTAGLLQMLQQHQRAHQPQSPPAPAPPASSQPRTAHRHTDALHSKTHVHHHTHTYDDPVPRQVRWAHPGASAAAGSSLPSTAASAHVPSSHAAQLTGAAAPARAAHTSQPDSMTAPPGTASAGSTPPPRAKGARGSHRA